MDDKIKYGICNCYYAKQTTDPSTGEVSFAAPVRLPGARSLTLDPQGELTKWYADNVAYWSGEAKNGYSGSLELALVPTSFKLDILGFAKDANNVIYEDEGATGSPFALLFQFEGDKKGTRHVVYNCNATRPGMSGNTKEESIEPETESFDIETGTIPVTIGGVEKQIAKSSTDGQTTAATYNGWFSEVYVPSGTPAATTQ